MHIYIMGLGSRHHVALYPPFVDRPPYCLLRSSVTLSTIFFPLLYPLYHSRFYTPLYSTYCVILSWLYVKNYSILLYNPKRNT